MDASTPPVIPTLLDGAASFIRIGGVVGCVVLHGFASSPAEVRWLAEYLAADGHSVFAPRLAGHGTHPQDLARAHWRDWYVSALDAAVALRTVCERVIAIGHSLGGLLALLLAAERQVDAVAALATPIHFKNRGMAAARWLKYGLPYTYQPDRSHLPEIIRAEQARRGEPIRGRVRYDRWSTAAVAQVYALARVTEAALPRVTVPLLLLYAENDTTAPLENLDRIVQRVNSARVERHIFTRTGHNLPLDIEREAVFARVGAFVQAMAADPAVESE